MNIQDIKNKIAALLAKAQASTFESEAATFLAKAEEMMEKYQVDIFDLNQDDPIGMTEGVRAQSGPGAYRSKVQVALARFYGCRPIRRFTTDRDHWVIELCGPESSRMTTELMTDFVWNQVTQAGAKMTAENPQFNKGEAIRHVAKALEFRINKLVAEQKKEGAAGTSSSLVVVDAVKAFIESRYADLSKTKGRSVTILGAAIAAASGISINRQVGGSGLRLK